LTPVKIVTRVQWQKHKPAPGNPFRSFDHFLSEDILHPQLQRYTVSRRHSDSNPRVSPRGRNFLHPAADWDRSRRSRRRL